MTDPVDTGSSWASTVLDPLGLTADSVTSAQVSCVDGGLLVTSEVRAAAYAADLGQALAASQTSDVVVNEPKLFAMVTGGLEFAVRARHDVTIVTATKSCR